MIEGRVAAVLNERQLAINRGSEHGVVEGMKFAVMAPGPIEITDPETDQALGELQQEKVRVRVVEVQPHYSIAQTYEKYGGRTGVLDYMDLYTSVPSKIRTLKTTDAVFKPISEAESYVSRGDVVRQVDD